MTLEFSRQIFVKSTNIKFHENPSSGSRVVPYGRTDMTKLIVAFYDTWIFSTDFRKIHKYQIPWKSVQWEPSCSIRTDRHDEANSRFSQFCETRLKRITIMKIVFSCTKFLIAPAFFQFFEKCWTRLSVLKSGAAKYSVLPECHRAKQSSWLPGPEAGDNPIIRNAPSLFPTSQQGLPFQKTVIYICVLDFPRSL